MNIPVRGLVSFDALRTYGLPGVSYINPSQMNSQLDRIRQADGVLFPEYWQVNQLLFGLKKRIFPSLPSYLIGYDKVEMTRCFQLLAPANVPETLILANTPEAAERVWLEMSLPLVAKIPRSSMGEGVFLIEEKMQWRAYLEKTPVIYAQQYLPIDRDLRVVWIGRQVVGGYWRIQAQQGFYNNIARGGEIVQGVLPAPAIELVERLALTLGIDCGGFDIAMVGNHPFIFEYNRLFGSQGLSGKAHLVNNAIWDYLCSSWGWDEPTPPSWSNIA